MLLPTVMLVLGLLIQPVCIAYTRTVMRSAAAEGARLLSTTSSLENCRSFVLRRLGAVPEVSLFHVGGDGDWQVEMTAAGEGRVASVSITGHVRPLPVLGVLSGALAERDDQGIVLNETVEERLRPDWLEGSYGSWVGVWG